MSDLVTFGETMLRLSPPTGERLESTAHLECHTGGAESNVAIAAARLGTDVTWLSKLPDSVLGRRVASDVRSHGVDARVVWSDEGRQGVYYLEQVGEFRTVIYDRENAAVTTARPDELDTGAVAGAGLFFTTGITPALSPTLAETTARLVEMAPTVGFDLNYRRKLWSPEEARETFEGLLPAVDLLFAPERDVRSVLGLSGEPSDVVETLTERYDCEAVVLTRGAEGALAKADDELVVQPAFESKTIDPIGTGDAFVGGFISRYLRGEPLETSLRWACATAALKRGLVGDVALVSESEVEAVLEDADDIDR